MRERAKRGYRAAKVSASGVFWIAFAVVVVFALAN